MILHIFTIPLKYFPAFAPMPMSCEYHSQANNDYITLEIKKSSHVIE